MIISVITVNYNNVDGLRRTIESVSSQTFCDYEFIVIDGNSSDGSKEVIDEMKPRFLHSVFISEPDKGIYDAMNKGVRESSGDYCLFMNSGDTFAHNNSLKESLPYLDTIDIVSGVANRPHNEVMYPPREADLNVTFFLRSSLNHQSTFIKRDLLIRHPYSMDYKIVSDTEFFFYSLIINNASYNAIPVIVAECEEAGESGNLSESLRERFVAISNYFPARMKPDLKYLELYNIDAMQKIGKIIRKPFVKKIYSLFKRG